jgi:hypothetical protein
MLMIFGGAKKRKQKTIDFLIITFETKGVITDE